MLKTTLDIHTSPSLKLRLPAQEILPNPLPSNKNNIQILNSRRNTNLPLKLPHNSKLHQLPQNPAKRLPTPRLRNHAPSLNHPTQRSNSPNLFPNKRINFIE